MDSVKAAEDKKSADKLKKYVDDQITHLFSSILDYCEVAVVGRDQYKALRSRILKISNDKIREISKQIDDTYDIKYVPQTEDVIRVVTKK